MGVLHATRTVEIDAPLERCFDIVGDLETTPEWQGQMISLEVIERDSAGRATLCEVVSDAKVKKARSLLRFEHHPPDRLTWEQEKGDVKWLVGSWQLRDLGSGRTEARYELEGDPGRILGLALRAPGAEGMVKDLLTRDATEGLKAQAEAG